MLSENTLEQIQDKIQVELLKRGFFAPVKVEFCNKHKNVKVTSENFQTIPVLFKSISIINFGGYIKEVEESKNKSLEIRIPVVAQCEHFDMGNNYAEIFAFKCIVIGENVYSIEIR